MQFHFQELVQAEASSSLDNNNGIRGVLIITFLVGYIFHAAINRIAEVEKDCQQMMELKARAEAEDVAKSQEGFSSWSFSYLKNIQWLLQRHDFVAENPRLGSCPQHRNSPSYSSHRESRLNSFI